MDAEYVDVDTLVLWMPSEESDPARLALLEAFELYGNDPSAWWNDPLNRGQYMTIVLANSAVETRLSRLVRRIASATTMTKKAVDEVTGADVSHRTRLTGLLPLITSLSGIQLLPPHIRDQAVALNSVRNKIVHSAEPPDSLRREEVGLMLAGAYFTFAYTEMLEETLLARCSAPS